MADTTMAGTILFICTGGTIDSRFEPGPDTLVPDEESSISNYIKKLKLHSQIESIVLCMKDSRDLTGEDRQKILETIQKAGNKKIIITHGTYTMPDTGKFLKENLGNTAKTIILTGSLWPLKEFAGSDAPFNLGFALAKVSDLGPGVYLCMNGKVFDPEKVNKNTAEVRFEEI